MSNFKASALALLFMLSATSFGNVQVNGAGASFPYPIYSKWFSEYHKLNPEIKFNYQAIGSGGGIRQLIKQTVDFGASDAPMKERDMKKAAWPVMHIPTVLGAVAIAYNVKGIKSNLKLDGKTLAQIFMGKITKWNDANIAALNPGISLPAQDILVVRRADGSGTTAIFTDYLSNVSPDWKKKHGQGKSLRWPTGIGAKGNDGVTNMVKQTNGAIGYIELAYAVKNKLNTVALKNKAGTFQSPTVEGVSRSAAGIKDMKGDFSISIVNAEGEGVYPISAFTYILLPQTDNPKLSEVKKFLKWALSKGQDYAAKLHYAPLPKKLTKSILKKL
jgi:phosphate transport system substrate-binding protein